jgi:hypothetical protein
MLWSYRDPILTNNIIWNNEAEEDDQFFFDYYSSSIEFYYCDVQDGIGECIGENNIDADPMFDSTNVDHPYSLTEDSPCIDMGTPDTTGLTLPEFDIAGNLRIWDGDNDSIAIVDMGAYEFGAPNVSVADTASIPPATSEAPNPQVKQNYPNPFNPVTTITYSLPKACHVSIKIYDITGRLVKTLLHEENPAGHYRLNWHGRDDAGKPVSTGTYIYQMRADDYQQTKRMVLLR